MCTFLRILNSSRITMLFKSYNWQASADSLFRTPQYLLLLSVLLSQPLSTAPIDPSRIGRLHPAQPHPPFCDWRHLPLPLASSWTSLFFFCYSPAVSSHPVAMASGPSLDFLSTSFSLSRVDDARLTPLQEGTSSAIALPLVDRVRIWR